MKSSKALQGLKTARDMPKAAAKKKPGDPTKGLKEAIKGKQVPQLALRAASLK
jgi:hypothetical protein